MAGTMLRKEIPVCSEKYDIHGVIKDYGFVTKLFFTHNGKEIEMGIHRNPMKGATFEELGRDIIESYISNLASNSDGRKLQLHYWYIGEHKYEDGNEYRIAHGIVTGHKKLADAIDMHSSEVKAIHVDEDEGEMVVTTRNSVYHCPLSYCRFKKQDEYPDIIPDYEKLKEKYQGTIEYPSIEPGKVLLVLANFSDYYFHSLFYVPKDSESGERMEYTGWPHVGTFQDSYLISTEDHSVDLRYFPHFQNIEFYSEDTDGCPFFIENIGDTVIYARTHAGNIRLAPGDRKEVIEENAEKDSPVLPDGDLYPAGVVD
ncbi:MAG: hypothetical protein E7301_00085 [Butyrivibrio sp.]|nr:hypothetical protein [Butyrivibrio sp.]